MSTSKTALVVGSTGLVGSELVRQLQTAPRYSRVVCLVRSNPPPKQDKVEYLQVDFDRLADYSRQLAADDVFCCLGTTIRKAGSQDAFRKVDYHYPVEVAKHCKANGAQQFLLVSALGANRNSSIFYNQVKGETEDAVSALGYRSVNLFRPSLLLGPRKESRFGEDVAKVFFRLFGFLIPKKYKGVHAAKVVAAMIAIASREEPGIFFHESDQLQKYSS